MLWNEAAERWLRGDRRGPAWVRALNRIGAPLLARAPTRLQGALTARQRVGLPFFTPIPPADDAPVRMLDVAPLYAGETVTRIGDIRPAGDLVRALAGSPGYSPT